MPGGQGQAARRAPCRDEEKQGTPPNIIHVLWDATAVGKVGIPEIQKSQGRETPRKSRRHVCHDASR